MNQRSYVTHFTCITSINSHNNPKVQLLLLVSILQKRKTRLRKVKQYSHTANKTQLYMIGELLF